jgi:hypothetical protein
VGWKEYFNGNPAAFKFNEIERAADYVILITLDRGESNNFYLKITNEDIKWGNDKTNINWVLDNGKWTTLFNDGNNNGQTFILSEIIQCRKRQCRRKKLKYNFILF